MSEADEPGLFDRLKRWLTGNGDGTSGGEPAPSDGAGGATSGCEETDEISCREAVERVYEYLDGELDPELEEEIRCHVEQCKRCYPMYRWEQMFLDFIRERADRGQESPALRRKVESLLEREAGGEA